MISLCQLQGNMHWPQRTDNIETDLALSFFFMTKMLSHPVLCVLCVGRGRGGDEGEVETLAPAASW